MNKNEPINNLSFGLLGHGYDTKGKIADVEFASKQPMIDLTEGNVTSNNNDNFYSKEVSGQSWQEFKSELFVSIQVSGAYKAFSGDVKASFDVKSSSDMEKSYFQYIGVSEKELKTLDISLNDMNFTDSVIKDFTEKNPRGIFEKYGTHFVTQVVFGGKYTNGYRSSRSQYQEIKTITAAAKAGLDGFVEVETKMKQTTQESGGESKIVSTHTVKGGLDNTDSIKEWLSTVEDNQAPISFGEKGLVPFWEIDKLMGLSKHSMEEWKTECKNYLEDFGNLKVKELKPSDNKQLVRRPSEQYFYNELSYYEPADELINDHYWFCQVAVCHNDPPSTMLAVPKINYNPVSNMLLPARFVHVWSMDGLTCWKVIPKKIAGGGDVNIDDYVGLGYVFTTENVPPDDKNIMCLHKDFCIKGIMGDVIWSDKGSKAQYDIAIYMKKLNDPSVDRNMRFGFYAESNTPGTNNDPSSIYVINDNKIEMF